MKKLSQKCQFYFFSLLTYPPLIGWLLPEFYDMYKDMMKLYFVKKMFSFIFTKDMFIDFYKEKETLMWVKNIDQLPLVHSLTKDWTWNLGVCPDGNLNLQPFGACANQLSHSARTKLWWNFKYIFASLK